MQSDKKKNNSQLKFILLEKIGKAKIQSVNNEVIIENAIKNNILLVKVICTTWCKIKIYILIN